MQEQPTQGAMASCNTPLHNRIHDHPDESTGNGDHDDQGVVEKSLQVPVEPTTATPLPVRNVNGNGNTNGNATEASSLYSPPPLTHHLDYKSKADIRRKELESLRQKQLAKPKGTTMDRRCHGHSLPQTMYISLRGTCRTLSCTIANSSSPH